MNTVFHHVNLDLPPITSFEGEWEALSNFYPCVIRRHNVTFRSAEQAYHWRKLANFQDRLTIMSLETPLQAKRFSRKCAILPDWNSYRTGVMLEVVRDKFFQNPDLLKVLMDTAPRLLIEGNHWNDTYWGAVWNEDLGKWVGENHLGRILMIIRDVL